MSGDLPEGWSLAKVEDLVGRDGLVTDGDWIESKDQSPDGSVRLIQLADIGDGRFTDKSSRFLTEDAAERLGCTYLRAGDLLIARMPDPLGRACVFPDLPQRCVTAVDVCIWRQGEGGVEPSWLMHCINSPKVRKQIQSLAGGTTRQRVSGGNLKRLEVPVPPISEQRRIAEKIESLFARSARARDHLAQIPRLIERYRQAILEAAFRGDLTADWRARNPGQILGNVDVEPGSETRRGRSRPKSFAIDLPVIPDGWLWTTFSRCVASYQNGLSKRAGASGDFFPVLRLSDIKEGTLVGDDPRKIRLERSERNKYALKINDLVFIRVNGSADLVGRCFVFASSDPWAFCDHFIRARIKDEVMLPGFASLLFESGFVRGLIETSFVSSAGQKTISQGTLNALPVPLPPLAEQEVIIDRVNSAIHGMSALLDEGVRAEVLVSRLDQSILDKAFAGKLVLQDPADEPATELLARIMAARSEAPAARGRRRKA